MSYCRKCGQKLGEEMEFCPNCGASVIQLIPKRTEVKRKERETLSVPVILAVVLIAIIVIVSLAAAFIFWGLVPASRITGSANLATRQMSFSDFTALEAGGGFEITVTQSDSYSISITANDNLFDYIEVSKTGDTLSIGLQWSHSYQSVTLKARITMPELYRFELSGGALGSGGGFSSQNQLILGISGGSTLNLIDMSIGDTQIDLSGGSIAKMEGAGADLVVDASSGSQLDLSNFQVYNANVQLSGGSQAIINVQGRLDADASGGSQLKYIGEPTLGNIQTSGGATVTKK